MEVPSILHPSNLGCCSMTHHNVLLESTRAARMFMYIGIYLPTFPQVCLGPIVILVHSDVGVVVL